MMYYIDYDRGVDYYGEWETEVVDSKEDALRAVNDLKEVYPDLNFRVTRGEELEVAAKETITKYEFK